jgi:hypothetical protein
MAGVDLNLSRRALLGAACAVPLGAVAPLLHTEDPAAARRVTRWNAALARFRSAEGALAAAEAADETAYDRLAARCDTAMCRLLRTPAPDAAALAVKLELTIEHLVWELAVGDACMAALLRDARRLAASPPRRLAASPPRRLAAAA